MPRRQVALLIAAVAVMSLSGWLVRNYYGPNRSLEETRSLGEDLVLQGRDAEYVRVWQRYVHRHPDEAAAHAALASGLIARERRACAEVSIARALELDSELPQAHYGQGMLHEWPADYAQADRDYAHALSLVDAALAELPDDVHLQRLRCRLLLSLSDTKGASAAAEEGLAAHPDDPWLRLLLASALQVDGRLEESIDECDRVLATRPDAVRACEAKAHALSEMGEDEAAIEALSQALEVSPHCTSALLYRSWLSVQQGDLKSARRDCATAVRTNKQGARGYFVRANLVEGELRAQSASGSGSYLFAWVNYYLQRRRAIKDLERTLELDPWMASAHVDLAQWRSWSGDDGEARMHAQIAVDLYSEKIEARPPTSAAYLWREGAYMVLCDYAAARADAQSALEVADGPGAREAAQMHLDYINEVDPAGAPPTSGAESPAGKEAQEQ